MIGVGAVGGKGRVRPAQFVNEELAQRFQLLADALLFHRAGRNALDAVAVAVDQKVAVTDHIRAADGFGAVAQFVPGPVQTIGVDLLQVDPHGFDARGQGCLGGDLGQRLPIVKVADAGEDLALGGVEGGELKDAGLTVGDGGQGVVQDMLLNFGQDFVALTVGHTVPLPSPVGVRMGRTQKQNICSGSKYKSMVTRWGRRGNGKLWEENGEELDDFFHLQGLRSSEAGFFQKTRLLASRSSNA